jgi:non-heme chloroperoxidase
MVASFNYTFEMLKSTRLIKGAKEIYYPGAPHGLADTHKDQLNADLLEFLRE